METITVFRLETEQGEGAFDATPWGVVDEFETLLPNYMDDHPMPYNDGGDLAEASFNGLLTNVRYGCSSIDALRHWFPPCVTPLLEGVGLQLTVWDVPAEDVFTGETQVAFKPDRARCCDRLPLGELHHPSQFTLPLAA